ncbi:SgcJ/EcaC family oxidoreductase [Agromyces sp. NPDC049794]|uniref:SgcJ/EcaC family oxidoreductase n=1 Tax=unclassified Agromyces TaxID=2639701 RepID=UPI0033EA35CF
MNDQETQVRSVVEAAELHQSDTEQFVELHTPDTAVINLSGRRVSGRAELAAAMNAALTTPLADVHTRSKIEEVRFLTPNVAIVRCLKHILDERVPEDRHDMAFPTRARLTYVLVEERGAWRIASAQTTPILAAEPLLT